MKSKILLVLLIVCVGCCPKAKQAIEPSQVIVTSYPSSIGEAGVAVYLPAGYAASKTDYPVLYLLHGSGDDEVGWLTKGKAKAILDSLITNQLCQPMIVVMPNGYLEQTGKHYPAETRLWMESTFEENFSQLITWTEAHFRTLTDKQHRAIAGLSMGGYGAMKVALTYPERYDACISLSGAMDVTLRGKKYNFTEYQSIFGYNMESSLELAGSEHDLFALAQKNKANNAVFPKLYMWCGTEDFLLDMNNAFDQHLSNLEIPHEFRTSEGNHRWAYWDPHIEKALQWLLEDPTEEK